MAPVLLIFITRLRMPVSTSLLLAGLFAESSDGFLSVLEKSVMGYVIAFVVTIILYPIC
jgi:hypothetical protein